MNQADPASIGRYVIQGALGRGAMGSIYKAHDPDIDRLVAIKLIRADLLEGADRDAFIARFKREAQAVGRCNHPNIVALYDFALHEGNPYLAMEFVNGITLVQARPADRRFAPVDTLFVMLQVLAALQCAHAAGVVHRDIKPANIMVVNGTQVKVADFGIARMNASDLTSHEGMVGTPSYMSPEQCSGGAVDARSDLFSVGIVMFEMLAGCKPFRGESTAELLAKIVMEPTPDLRALAPRASAELCAIVGRCLAKAPDQRFASAAELAQALQAAAAHSGSDIDECTIVAPAAAEAAGAPGAAQPASFDPQWLDTLSRQLAGWVGPIASYWVQTAARRARTAEDLCAELQTKIDNPGDRQAFQNALQRLNDSRAGTGTGPGAAATSSSSAGAAAVEAGMPAGVAATPITAAELEALQARLAQHLGPMAKVLVKRAAPSATSLLALKQTLAAQISDERGRAAFLNG